MNIMLTNDQIYTYATDLMNNFSQEDIQLPVKINFYLQKNSIELLSLAQNIEQQRVAIIQQYGTLNEETQNYDVPKEDIITVQNKVNELFNLTQEVKIYKVRLEDFGDIKLTPKQMKTLLFMIEEGAEEEYE